MTTSLVALRFGAALAPEGGGAVSNEAKPAGPRKNVARTAVARAVSRRHEAM
jgi:hypothetical protein